MNVADNATVIQNNIHAACERAGRSSDSITVIAVTKYVTAARALEAYEAGIRHFGENRPEGLLEKKEAIGEEAVWHFIGSLQTRKVKSMIDHTDYIHSLDRLALAEEIQKRAARQVKCFVQVNVSGEESKHGLKPEEVQNFIEKLKDFPKIQVAGLMTMAPYTDNEQEIRNCFRTLKHLQESIKEQNLAQAPCTELSMGMSNDYIIAAEEGATFIRIGSSLVGNESGGV